MGEITQKDIDKLPETEKKKVEKAKKEVAKTMPKKVKKTEEKPKKVKKTTGIEELKKDLNKLGNWVGDIDKDLKDLEDLVARIAKRMGME